MSFSSYSLSFNVVGNSLSEEKSYTLKGDIDLPLMKDILYFMHWLAYTFAAVYKQNAAKISKYK